MQSGVGLIRGWVCDAGAVAFSIDGGPLQAIAYGSDRPDTATACGDRNNGFGFTQNWSEIGDGVHNLRAFADGAVFADVDFTVTTLGRTTFLTGLRAQFTLRDFPGTGGAPQVRWSEPDQNFVFARQAAIPANTPPPADPRVTLESPSQGSYQSGVALIRGWACEAQRIEFSIDGGPRQAIAYGSDRPDTVGSCGDADNGFGETFNWNRIGAGAHNLRAYRDGVEFANVNFAVTTLGGEEFATGLGGQFKFADFPETGQTTTAEWSEPAQNFIVARSTATPSRLALVAAITDALNPMAVAGQGTPEAGTAGEGTGVRAAKRGDDGQPTQLEGLTWANQTGQAADLQLSPDGLPAVYTDSGGLEARFDAFNLADPAPTVTVSFFRNGAAQGDPATVPIEGGRLRALQTMAERVRQAVQSAPAESGRQLAPLGADPIRQAQEATPSRFTLTALLVNSYWYGSVAAGETLCAVGAAAARAGVSGPVAADACQSPFLKAFLTRAAARRGAAAEPPASGIDPLVQQALQADADVPNAPCGANTPAGCLEPAATELQNRQGEDAQTPTLPREEPSEPGPPDVPVPSLVGLSQNAAIAALQSAGLVLGTVTQQASSTAPTGTVISQNPAAGTQVASGTRVNLAVSSGSVPVTVPNVVGQSQDDAASTLSEAGLTVGTVTEQTSSTVPVGSVISQNPRAGAQVDSGTAVNLVVSSGSALVTVPNVVGQSLGGATTALQNAGLTVGTITQQASSTVLAGSVISQDPMASTQVASGTRVNLVVSSGPSTYLLTLTTAGTGSGQVSGGGSYPVGASVTLTATPAVSSTFAGWSPSPCTTSFTMPAQNLTCTATFNLRTFTVSTAASPTWGGTITPSSRTVNYNDRVSFTVTADSDYPYYYYVDSVDGCGGNYVGDSQGGTYTTGPIIADCTVTATFTSGE